jgi:GH15 family glucan-1,4-alpha-glucosidase
VTPGSALYARSVETLRAGQAPSGGYVASPRYPTYRYAWLRDGSFCALAMDAAGETASAAAFHAFVARTVLAHAAKADRVLARLAAGARPEPAELLPTRYTLDGGEEEPGDWPNFQLDGYGTWLWALERHLDGADPGPLGPAAELVARYLAAAWQLPCWDCWEELGDGEHGSTLGAVAAGLGAAGRLLGDRRFTLAAERVRARLLGALVRDGRLAKGRTDPRVDASLLWVAVPFGVLPPDDPVARATAGAVERDLVGPTGGVRRYLGDTFYGGGEWTLLTSWLAWYHAVAGDPDRARQVQHWVAERAQGEALALPEQSTEAPQDAAMVRPWVERWGPVATPLLWAHAMVVLLEPWISSP